MPTSSKPVSTRTVGRGKALMPVGQPPTARVHEVHGAHLELGDSLLAYDRWPSPTVIVSDGAYGVLGFDGDTSDHLGIPGWYAPHVEAWSRKATGGTTLWFWNSEIGWAAAHPVLERNGWRYVNANTWNKGRGHIAGNVNTATIRRFPVVSEVCVQYVHEPRLDGLTLQRWLYREWKRSGLPLRDANRACGVRNVATRKYLDQGHLWYYPPPAMFEGMARHANEHGDPAGRPYFSEDGRRPMDAADWARYRAKFRCPLGYTNIWDRGALHGRERVKVPQSSSKAAHLNQKPLDLMRLIIEASSDPGDVVWEPFGGLFSGSLAAVRSGRRAFACEQDPDYFTLGVARFREPWPGTGGQA